MPLPAPRESSSAFLAASQPVAFPLPVSVFVCPSSAQADRCRRLLEEATFSSPLLQPVSSSRTLTPIPPLRSRLHLPSQAAASLYAGIKAGGCSPAQPRAPPASPLLLLHVQRSTAAEDEPQPGYRPDRHADCKKQLEAWRLQEEQQLSIDYQPSARGREILTHLWSMSTLKE